MIAGPPPPPPVHFAWLPATWRTFATSTGAYAVSWGYRPNPTGWATHMPKNGIAVTVFFPNERRPQYPPLRLLVPRRPATTLEGAPGTPEYRIHGRVLGRNVEIWIDIRRRRPTRAELRVAQRVVSRLRFG